ncbi:MAG TPA: ricin-type beta-trefoil lectin domain protein [Balneolaceae bacterium]|nr:ricin-type beta-trefoil lectin domain protein [Balneolaceae bacterium]
MKRSRTLYVFLAGVAFSVSIIFGTQALAMARTGKKNKTAILEKKSISTLRDSVPNQQNDLAKTPPMGWNDWAQYQCGYTSKTILDNARALVSSGLAARGYNNVTIDDCWMARKRNAAGNLQPNSKRFPQGIAPVADSVHAMGLKFGIYEDAGSKTCGGYAGSGAQKAGGKTHFMRDMHLFAKWGVDYVKLDGCNVQVPKGVPRRTAYRKAYASASAAIRSSGRPMVFLESAPAYFQGKPAWYNVLGWAGKYGQLWREGSDIKIFRSAHPSAYRFGSVMWNYAYNLPLGRYQKPGNWNNPDFIIGGSGGMNLAETRSQMALWSMMSAPLKLSVNVGQLSSAAIRVLGNKRVIRVDQDPLGRMATLVRRTKASDVLLKKLADGDYAVAVFNHGDAPIHARIPLNILGFSSGSGCSVSARNLWNGVSSRHQKSLEVRVKSHDTIIWRLHPASACGSPSRTGAIVMTIPSTKRNLGSRTIDSYGRCLSSTGVVRRCQGTKNEDWTVSNSGSLRADNRCLTVTNGSPEMKACTGQPSQHWVYKLNGNLVNASDHLCLSIHGVGTKEDRHWRMQACGDNEATQIWALPNKM